MEENGKAQDAVTDGKETIPQLFGRNVRKYRKARKLTQEQLSEKLEISQKHLSIIETGTQFASASLKFAGLDYKLNEIKKILQQ